MHYPTNNINITVNTDLGEITLSTKSYRLEILVNTQWVGYTFNLDKGLTSGISQGSSIDTDLYPLDRDISFTNSIFYETLTFVDDLLSDRLFYGVIRSQAVFAKPIGADRHRVTFAPKRRFFATIVQEEWPKNRVVNHPDLRQLFANER